MKVDAPVKLSARNALIGTVESMTTGEAMATVKVRLSHGGQIITAAVTRESAEDLGLSVGSTVTAIIKSTEVMLAAG